MKYSELFNKSLKEVVENECEPIEQKIHTDDDGNVKAIEIKYIPKEYSKNAYTPPASRNLWD